MGQERNGCRGAAQEYKRSGPGCRSWSRPIKEDRRVEVVCARDCRTTGEKAAPFLFFLDSSRVLGSHGDFVWMLV